MHRVLYPSALSQQIYTYYYYYLATLVVLTFSIDSEYIEARYMQYATRASPIHSSKAKSSS
ncbi:hypothetical protein BD311DRAFT_204302 [Dichomitus squalens]|uniref:Uncharacterized protein n=1 Tax=Dichomitus squalens TaxID=114155 RepID=A0A4Q9N842_9APHY|nr:hypothetical protein BD311DRAFT_204302 [Dichomitus squalens]